MLPEAEAPFGPFRLFPDAGPAFPAAPEDLRALFLCAGFFAELFFVRFFPEVFFFVCFFAEVFVFVRFFPEFLPAAPFPFEARPLAAATTITSRLIRPEPAPSHRATAGHKLATL